MSFEISKVCRVCLEQGVLTSIFALDFATLPCFMMEMCAKVKIRRLDGLPQQICSKCIYRLGVAYHFKQECENSDLRLRHYLGLEIPPLIKDASTSTETIPEPSKSSPILQRPKLKRKRKSRYKRKPEDEKLKRGPKSKPKVANSCYECGKSFKCTAQLEMHIRIHTGERPFVCTYCPRRFAQKHNLVIHTRIHTGEKPFQCEICSKTFTALGNFTAHQKIHTGIRDQICPVCNRGFINSGELNRHIARHTGIKNHHCNICGKTFARNRDSVAHKKKVHNIVLTALAPEPATNHSAVAATVQAQNFSSDLHKCDQCGKATGSAPSLAQHYRNVHRVVNPLPVPQNPFSLTSIFNMANGELQPH